MVATIIDEILISNAANSGRSSMPNFGYNTPAATGIASTLYIEAQKRFCFIFLTVALESLIARKISAGSDFINTIFAVSIATSVPAPIAMPISAVASAGRDCWESESRVPPRSAG